MPLSAHPFLFGAMFVAGAVELGLTAYLVHEFNNNNPPYPTDAFKSRLRFLVFCSSWTLLLAVLHWLFNAAIGAFMVIITLIFWAVGAALFHIVNQTGRHCGGTAFNSRCHEQEATEVLAWTEVALTVLAFLAILFHVHGNRGTKRSYQDGLY